MVSMPSVSTLTPSPPGPPPVEDGRLVVDVSGRELLDEEE